MKLFTYIGRRTCLTASFHFKKPPIATGRIASVVRVSGKDQLSQVGSRPWAFQSAQDEACILRYHK